MMFLNKLAIIFAFLGFFITGAIAQTATPPAAAGACASMTTVQNTFQAVGNDSQLSKGEVDVCATDAAMLEPSGDKIPYIMEAKGNTQINPGDRLVRGQPGHFIRKGNIVGWLVTLKNPSAAPFDKAETKDTLQGGFKFLRAYRLASPISGNKLDVAAVRKGQPLDMRELAKDVAGITVTGIKGNEQFQLVIETSYEGGGPTK